MACHHCHHCHAEVLGCSFCVFFEIIKCIGPNAHCYRNGQEYEGGNLGGMPLLDISTAPLCRQLCLDIGTSCVAWAYNNGNVF